MELALTILMLAGVVAVIAGPLRRRGAEPAERSDLAAIEAAKEAKYREILDTELDFRTGKLADEDYREIDRALRGEAIELSQRIEAERARPRVGPARPAALGRDDRGTQPHAGLGDRRRAAAGRACAVAAAPRRRR